MYKRLAVSIVAAMAVGMSFPLLRAQSAAPQVDKWNSIPPARSTYAGKKPGPAPRRDMTGIWDTSWGGVAGAPEYPATYVGYNRTDGGALDESSVTKPLPYTPAGRAALIANKPSGPGVRQVDSALSNDPANLCDPLGFPYMFMWESRVINMVQSPTQVVMINPFYGGYRIIWTDGRALPKDPDPRWNGYSVGRWVDDVTFAVQTNGLTSKSWLDHAGRPHSEQAVIDETYRRVDMDTMELTMKITDPVMYTQPWVMLNKGVFHNLPADFDIRENLCSPSENQGYNDDYANTAIRPGSKP